MGIGTLLKPMAFWSFIAVVVLAPLPYGSVHIWSSFLLAILTGCALALWAIAAVYRSDVYTMRGNRYALLLALVAAVLAWLLLQAATFTPAQLHHPLWSKSLLALGASAGTGAISLDPEATLLSAVRIATYTAIFWMAMHFARSARHAHIIVWAIAISGFLYATYGLWAYLTDPEKILFTDKWAYHLSLTSTFVNRNHYGVFAGMGLIASFALLIRYLKKDASGAFNSSRSFLNSVENLELPVFVLIAICIVIGSALLMTQSRGGIAFSGTAMVVLILLLHAGGNIRKRSSLALVGVLIAGGIIMFAISGDDFVNRVAGNLWNSDRGAIHAVAVAAIADAPLTGHGAGTFPTLFHMYRGADFPPIAPTFAAAHSVYLEFAAGAGIVAAIAYFAVQFLIVARCFLGTLIRRRDQLYPAIGVASGVLVGFHSYFDFGPQVPGVSVTFAVLLGVAFAQSWPSDRRPAQSGDR